MSDPESDTPDIERITPPDATDAEPSASPRRAAVYFRVGSAAQLQGGPSLERQLEALARAEAEGGAQ